jgi:HEAT repeat protein
VRQFARLIHPDGLGISWGWGLARPAERLPVGVEKLVPILSDPAVSVRVAALFALAAYVKLDNPDIEHAIQRALGDPKHKVRHYAARILGVRCPGCGSAPKKEAS